MPGEYRDSIEREATRQTSIRRVVKLAQEHDRLAARQRDGKLAASHRRAAAFWRAVARRMRDGNR